MLVVELHMRKLGPNTHAVLDYLSLPPYFILPPLLRWSKRTAAWTYPVGLFHAGLTVFTNYPMGLVKCLSYPLHGLIEYVSVLHLVVWPFMMRFPERSARGYYVFASVFLLTVCLATDFYALEKQDEELRSPTPAA